MAIKIQGVDVIDDSRNAVNLTNVTASGSINFTGTGSIQVPAGTTAERPGSPAAGEIRYNTDEESLEQYNGELWTAVGGGFERIHVTSSHNSLNNEYIYADTESGSLNITLPASPNEYDTVIISDEAGNFAFNNVTVSRNGSTIAGKSENFILGLSFREYTFVYYDNTWNVFVKEVRKDTGAGFSIDGPSSGNEGDEILLVINGYDTGASYNIQVSDGTFTRTSEAIHWTLPSVSQDQSHFIQVEESSTSGTEIVTYEVQVFNIPTIPDDAVSVSDPSGTLFFESNTYEQQTADNDWIEFQGEVTVDPSSIESLTYDSANSTTSELRFTGFENYESKILLTEAYESFTVGSIINDSRDISNATYDSVSFDVSSEEADSTDIAFSPDGTKMFVAGNDSDTIYSYTLSTPFNLSTASYDNVSLNYSNRTMLARDFKFSYDGTKLYVEDGLFQTEGNVLFYELSTPFDLSTASYVIEFTNILLGSFISPDGSKLFDVRYDPETGLPILFSYTLYAPFDISTASYDNLSLNINDNSDIVGIVRFSNDGSKLFVLNDNTKNSRNISSYTLSTPFDISTASYDNISFSLPDYSVADLVFSTDGTKFFTLENDTNTIYSYSTNAFTTYVNPLQSVPTEIYGPDRINQYIALSNSKQTTFVSDKAFNVLSYSTDTGTANVTLGYDNDSNVLAEINNEVVLTTGFNILNTTYDNVSLDVSSEESNPFGIEFSTDGTKMFVVGATSDSVHSYTLSTSFDLSTASYDNVSLDVSSEDSAPIDAAFSTDGTKMFVLGLGSDTIYSYTLSTPFDLSTASYDNVSLSVTSEDSIPEGITFSPDGTKMFMVGRGSAIVYSYTLSTGFDLSTASYDNVKYDPAFEDMLDIEFNSDGTKMFILGGNTTFIRRIYSFTLSIGFDLSTASDDESSFFINEEEGPESFKFNNNGTKLFVIGSDGDRIYSYSLFTDVLGRFEIDNIVVSNSETILTLSGTPSLIPDFCVLQNQTEKMDFEFFNESNNNLVMTSDRYLTDNGKRFLKFKIQGDDIDNDVLNARVNLWKGA